MIISKIQGGLGNQMFQWAYGRYLSNKYQTELRLDSSFYNLNLSPKREFLLNKFQNISPNTDLKVSLIGPIYKIEDNFTYKELPSPVGSNYYLDGYWQSEKYFKEIESIIREDFKPSDETMNKLLKTPLIDKNTISLHIRRTDYVTSNGYHPVQSIEYYNKAVETIGEYDYIFVFSDDIKWCKENLHFDNMIFMEGFTDIEDLHLMSMCKNNIIANSSFSWWGAWLNNNFNKKVIAPSKWFGEKSNLNEADIIPENWIKI
jgi:hypothetical protein